MAVSAIVMGAGLGIDVPGASAQEMTAGVILEKMSGAERVAYLAGIIEGLAYARYVKDDKQAAGMGCIYDWFYKTRGRSLDIEKAFGRYKEHSPGAIVAALVTKECGK
ncbi:hypothetical protein STHU_03180 [Allostella humosa]|nr:hypothetical protein [Stella humosa]BBK29684.1 hypothetical protein STHU_03180 [Stella humosa]